MHLGHKEGKGYTRFTFKHFIITSINTMSHTWPRNPHDCGQFTTRTPSSQALHHKDLEPLIVLPQTIRLPPRFYILLILSYSQASLKEIGFRYSPGKHHHSVVGYSKHTNAYASLYSHLNHNTSFNNY